MEEKMFTTKQNTLFETAKITKGSNKKANAFIDAGMNEAAKTLSGNGALKYSTTQNPFVDQFGNLSSYKRVRTYDEVASDMSVLWGENPKKAVMFTLYMRMITRKVKLIDGSTTETVQRGAGLKNDAILRMLWIYNKDRNTFWKNIHLFVAVGSWKDIFQMLRYDLMYHGWDNKILNWNSFREFIFAGLENPTTSNLIKKYLPQIKARSKCKTLEAEANTVIAKWLASGLNLDYKGYRQLKTSGTAHEWQKLISKGNILDINFDTVHGRALSLLVSGKFIENNGLVDKYTEWVENKPTVKFTGFVHELFKDFTNHVGRYGGKSNLNVYQALTVTKQFDGLVELGKTNANCESGLIVVRDTSCSMTSNANGTNMSSHQIAKALALYFSAFLEGHFKDAWIEFSSSAKMHKWKGSTVVEKWDNDNAEAYGSTNFMGVASLFVKLKKNGVAESDFPTGILCVSDGEFNPADLGKTNVESFRNKLRSAGFSKEYCDNFKIVLWNLPNSYYGRNANAKFEGDAGVENVYYFSGYEASTIAFLTGVEGKDAEKTANPKNAEELFEAAMNQEILNMVEL